MRTLQPHLVHVIPDLCVKGEYCLALEWARALPAYQHTLLYENPLIPDCADNNLPGWPKPAATEVVYQAQSTGLNLLQTDEITGDTLLSGGFTGAILYNVVGHNGIGQAIPSVYYSYGIYDPASEPSHGVIPCSRYACKVDRFGQRYAPSLDVERVIPPSVETQGLRNQGPTKSSMFVVGILTSGAYDKYPCKLVMQLLRDLPDDVGIMLTTLPKYKHLGVEMAIAERVKKFSRRIALCPVRPAGGTPYLSRCNALIFESEASSGEPYGRMAIEAMAMGKPVICANSGVYADTLKHDVNALLYKREERGEILEHVERLRKDTELVTKLGDNGKLWASWQDTSIHIGALKHILRTMGT